LSLFVLIALDVQDWGYMISAISYIKGHSNKL